MKPIALKNRSQFTGNAGPNYIGWQLSRRGGHVTPTIRNSRGSHMFVTDEHENVKFGVQPKALSKRHSVPLGLNLENLSEWLIEEADIDLNPIADHEAKSTLRPSPQPMT